MGIRRDPWVSSGSAGSHWNSSPPGGCPHPPVSVVQSVEGGRVDVLVEHPRLRRFACPECDQVLPVYDHAEKRAWCHLDSCAFLTYLHARHPRVECPTHGDRQVALPWAEPMSRFTVLFERLAIDVLKECEGEGEGAARLVHLSWDEAWHLMDRAVQRGLGLKPRVVVTKMGVDAKAAGKGYELLPDKCAIHSVRAFS